MKYSSSFSISGAGGVASYVFSQNSVYDPDVTSAGGSCVGFNTLINLYERFRVIASTIRLTLPGQPGIVVAAVAATHLNLGTSTSALQVGGAQRAKPHAVRVLSTNNQGPSTVLQDSVTTQEMVGDKLYDASELFGVGSNDPPLQFFWCVGSNELNSLPYTFQGIVEIEYITEFTVCRSFPS